MAQTDFVVRLRAEDQLSGTIGKIKTNLKETGQAASYLDDIKARFQRITESTAPAKRQLRDIQKIMAEMNLKGLDNTAVFTEMAQYAGSMRDALSDASTAVNAFANDNFKLQAMTQAMQGVAAAGSIVTAGMALFGKENDKVAQALLKVQSAMALLNGVQAIANVLNKDSALMLRIKQIRMLASTRTTAGHAAATTADTAAAAANTVATTANTVAQNAWNVAKAVAKALLGDWTGLLLVGAVAVGTYALATSDSTEAQKEQADATNRQAENMKKYRDAVASSASSMIASFKTLQSAWRTLSTDNEKIKWIQDNQEAFKQLGLQINSVTAAENAFIKNSKRMVQALMLRAAQDSLKDLMKTYADDYTNSVKNAYGTAAGGGYQYTAKAGQGYSQTSDVMRAMKKAMVQNGDTRNGAAYNENEKYYYKKGDQFVLSDYGAQQANRVFKEEANERLKTNLKNAETELEKGQRIVENISAGLKSLMSGLGLEGVFITEQEVKTPTIHGTGKGSSGKGSTQAEKPKTPLEEYREFKNAVDAIQNSLDYGLIDEEAAKEAIDAINKKVTEKFGDGVQLFSLKDTTKDILTIYTEFEKLARDVQARFAKGLVSEEDAKKEIDKINEDLKATLGENAVPLKLEVKEVEVTPSDPTIKERVAPEVFAKGSATDRRLSYDNALSNVEDLKIDLQLGIITPGEAQTAIDEINAMLQDIGLEPLKLRVTGSGAIETAADSTEKLSGAISNVGNAFGSLSSGISELGDNAELTKAAAIAAAIGQLALTFAGSMKGTFTPWDWIAAAAAGSATLISLVATLSKFETGGIVGGTSYTGDSNLVRVNSGEMILNRTQQARLFNALNGSGPMMGGGGNVRFVLEGSKLVGCIDNYNRKTSKAR